ncbi:MAG: nucleotidyltransferase family protein [Betaproteobacteria bacterium]|nr:nucleotidyltransferase family protein [Betaproteobacteria bacterium]
MRALLLAAGYGTRLRPLTDNIPKCLVSIRGRSLLDYWLELLLTGGIESILVNTHYFPEKVSDFVGASRWKDRVTLMHEEVLLGTGGTILHNRKFFRDEAFLVAHADNLTRFDVRAFIARHASRPPEVVVTMMTFATDAPQSCGIVVEDDKGIVRDFHEKSPNPPGNRANAAVYVFEPEIIKFLESLGRSTIDLSTEVLPRYLGRIRTHFNTMYHRDIGTPNSLRKAELEFPPL